MAKLNDYAKTYESKVTKNISELSEVLVDLELEDDEFETSDKKTGETKIVKQKVVTINNESYRVPNSVFQQLRMLLEDNPTMKKFKVRKSGIGMETRYQVIPIFSQ